jgi:hypothetical protein
MTKWNSFSRLGSAAAAAAVVFVLVAVLAPGRAEARRRYGGSFGGEPGASTFGIGLILGSPTGLSMELRLSNQTALDFALGLDDFREDDGGYFHFDYLVYLADLARGGSVSLPVYLGVGLAFWDEYDRFDNDDELNLGLRVPFGIAIAFRTAPIQFFGELAIRVLLVDDDDGRDDDDVDLTGGLGFRVYF